MKIRILINETLTEQEKKQVLDIIKNNKYLKDNANNTIYFADENWEKVFCQITDEFKVKFEYERLVVFTKTGFLSFFYFSKELGFVSSCPFDEQSTTLCRAHNNANTLVLTKNVAYKDYDKLINIFFETPFEGGRHITRYNLMQVPYTKSQIVYKFNENVKNTVVLCSDHAGYAVKERAKQYIIDKGWKVIDVGCDSLDSTHHSLYAIALVKNANKANCGIAFCSTGVGMANTINNFRGMNCFLCSLPGQAKEARSRYNANVMALGARFITWERCKHVIDEFLATKRGTIPEIEAMDKYGYDFDKKKFQEIKIEANIKIPKELL